MANITLPSEFAAILNGDQKLAGAVNKTLSDFGDVLIENKLYFFEDYTDHGIRHIENVLAGSERLIRKETIENILTVNDISYYVLTVILHDIGMHISYEGFISLINGENDDILVKELDKLKWIDLWKEYLAEAKRFNGKQLFAIFGDENTIIHDPLLKKKGDLTNDDRKLIGEFIRRNHPRMAHEIAIKGLPGVDKGISGIQRVQFCEDLEDHIKNLIGLVARSHGTDLRKSIDYLIREYGKESRRNGYGTHWIFLMVLLRIGDYLQIDKSRSSEIILKLKAFDSPISKLEHQAHLVVDHIDDKYQDDPERIFVTVSPKDSKMHLKIKSLIKSIQNEFDISWAVLGELYGNLEEKPEIKYRRITSNLENDEFDSRQNYVPDKFVFKANEDIIKLLIGPLYGNDPTYGVRELLQNGVDACVERRLIELNKYMPLVQIRVYEDKGEVFFEIKDNGKGMSIDEIKNYFLNAGASYRTSLDWKKQYLDEEGKSKIQRNGRFGIGALAAFLIGNEIYVETRRYDSTEGYSFSAKLSSDQINVTKNQSIEQGTLIRIKITEEIVNELKNQLRSRRWRKFRWTDWYTLSSPKVTYKFFSNQIIPYPSPDPYFDKFPKEWKSVDSDGYKKILWTYSEAFSKQEVVCNGIVIPGHLSYKYFDLGLIDEKPKILVFDNDGIMPISLSRNDITDNLSFSKDLKIDLYKDLIAKFLAYDCDAQVKGNKIKVGLQETGHLGSNKRNLNYNAYGPQNYYFKRMSEETFSQHEYNLDFMKQILISKKGYILNYNYFINRITNGKLFFMQADSFPHDSISLDLKESFFFLSNVKLNAIGDYRQAIEGKFYSIEENNSRIQDTRIYMKTEKYNYLFNSNVKTKRLSDALKEMCVVISEKKGWIKLHLGNPKDTLIDENFLVKHKSEISFIREAPLYSFDEGDTDLNSLLSKYIGNDVIIPYSVKERKEKYKLAFEELKEYLRNYL